MTRLSNIRSITRLVEPSSRFDPREVICMVARVCGRPGSELPGMTVRIPLIERGTHDIRMRFTGILADEIRFARADEHEVSFNRTEVVAPTFAPRRSVVLWGHCP